MFLLEFFLHKIKDEHWYRAIISPDPYIICAPSLYDCVSGKSVLAMCIDRNSKVATRAFFIRAWVEGCTCQA